MDFVEVKFPGDRAYARPIGDIHVGAKGFTKDSRKLLLENLEWLKEHKHEAFGILMGDVFDVAGRGEKTSPFDSDSREFFTAVEIFKPYAELFVGAISGNHEQRILNQYGIDLTEIFCDRLGIPFLGNMALVRVQVGKREDCNSYWNTYTMCVHHTVGGGGKLGNGLTGVEKLAQVCPSCDVYAGGHNHKLVQGHSRWFVPTATGPQMRKVHFVSCGSYLEYEGYPEQKLYVPGWMGSPRVRFDGRRDQRNVHVSL